MKVFVALHVNADYTPSPDGFFYSGQFRNWECVSWGERKGKPFCFWTDGNDAMSMWIHLRQLSREHGELTVWSWKTWPLWCVTNGTEEVSQGMLRLDVSGQKPDHTFIAGDPPTIITFDVPGGSTMAMLDLANFGVTPEMYGLVDGCGALAATKLAVTQLHSLCKSYGLGELRSTAAAQAWHVYRSFHQPQPSAVPTSSIGSSRLEEAAYFGGRCECRRLGRVEQAVYDYDVTAMYTTIGLFAMFPREYVDCWDAGKNRSEPWLEDGLLMIADVTLQTDKALYPVSELNRGCPLRAPRPRDPGERVIYPVGTFRTALCGPELAVAVGHGHVREWHRVQYYEPARLMADWSAWALHTRELVKAGPLSHLGSVFKKILNSLPGKWGQRRKVWVDWTGDWDEGVYVGDTTEWLLENGRNPVTGAATQFRTIAGKCQYLVGDELAPRSCPAVAAFWTSYGRVDLNGYIWVASRQGYNDVIQYDTDGLAVTVEGALQLELAGCIDGRPGTLRKISGPCRDGNFLGLRNYFLNNRWVVAGGRKEDVRHEGFNEQLRKAKVCRPVQNIVKGADRAPDYKHGSVDENGFVKPFVLGNSVTGESNEKEKAAKEQRLQQ